MGQCADLDGFVKLLLVYKRPSKVSRVLVAVQKFVNPMVMPCFAESVGDGVKIEVAARLDEGDKNIE